MHLKLETFTEVHFEHQDSAFHCDLFYAAVINAQSTAFKRGDELVAQENYRLLSRSTAKFHLAKVICTHARSTTSVFVITNCGKPRTQSFFTSGRSN